MVGRVLEGSQRGPRNGAKTSVWAADRRTLRLCEGPDRCKWVLRSVDRRVGGQSSPLGLGEQADWTLICHVGDHAHEVSWIDGDRRAARISMVTMQPC